MMCIKTGILIGDAAGVTERGMVALMEGSNYG